MSEADVIIQSSDHVNFRVHKLILASSQFFKDMFSLPQPPDAGEFVDGLPVAHLPEDAELIRALITILYPIPSQIPVSYDDTLALLGLAKKYDMDGVGSAIRAELCYKKLPVLVGPQAFRAYAIASNHRLIPEMDSAARRTLDFPMTFKYLGEQLELFKGWALGDLACFRRLCRDNLVSCFESFLDAHSSPSTIWVGCKEEFQHHPWSTSPRKSCHSDGQRRKEITRKGNQDGPTLPAWLWDFFSQQIEELMEGFANALTKPSSIREEYLMALQAHNDRYIDGCTSCLKVHAREGSEYSERLVEELEKARNIRMPPSLLSPFGVRSWDPSTGKRPFWFEPSSN
jgi:BTB/POZ domain